MSSVYDISSMYDSYKQSVQSATGSKAQSALNAVNRDNGATVFTVAFSNG